VLKEIVAFRKSDDNPYQEKIEIMLRWQGGDHTKLELRRKARRALHHSWGINFGVYMKKQ